MKLKKAHPDVFNLLLQALDDGHMTDGLGRKNRFQEYHFDHDIKYWSSSVS